GFKVQRQQMGRALSIQPWCIEFQPGQNQHSILSPCPLSFTLNQVEVFLELVQRQRQVPLPAEAALAPPRIGNVVRNTNAIEFTAPIKIYDLRQFKAAIGI